MITVDLTDDTAQARNQWKDMFKVLLGKGKKGVDLEFPNW